MLIYSVMLSRHALICDDVNTWFWVAVHTFAIFHLYLTGYVTWQNASSQRVFVRIVFFSFCQSHHTNRTNNIHLENPQLNGGKKQKEIISLKSTSTHKRENEITSGFQFNCRLRLSYGPLAIRTNEFLLSSSLPPSAYLFPSPHVRVCVSVAAYVLWKVLCKLFITISAWFTNKSDPFADKIQKQ